MTPHFLQARPTRGLQPIGPVEPNQAIEPIGPVEPTATSSQDWEDVVQEASAAPEVTPSWMSAIGRRVQALVPGPVEWLIAATVVGTLILATQVTRASPELPPAPPQGAPAAESPAAPATQKLTARGEVLPAARARVGTIGGGVVQRVSVKVGDAVEEQQEIARLRGPSGTEVLTAPWAGTVTSIPAHTGDTVTAGTVVATIGDLSRLQVATRDVDEFLIKEVQPGQPVTLTVDALDGRVLRGVVRSTAIQPEPDTTGDEHYPVVVDLVDWAPQMRLGMTVRVNFAQGGPTPASAGSAAPASS